MDNIKVLRTIGLRSWLLVSVAIWAGIVDASSAAAQDTRSLRSRLLTEAPQEWGRYREFVKTLQGTARGERQELTGEKPVTWRSRSEWKKAGGSSVEEHETLGSGTYWGEVKGQNPQYHFVLSRQRAAQAWVIKGLTSNTAGPPDQKDSPDDLVPGLSLFGPVLLPDVVQSPGFTLTSVTSERAGGNELVRMAFLLAPEDKVLLRGGWVLLDPDRDWVIRKGELQLVDEARAQHGKYTIQYDYKDGSGRHPIITKAVNRYLGEDERSSGINHEERFQWEVDEHRSVPAREFSLSAYGLPEPFLTAPVRPRWHLWATGAAISCLLLGAFLRRLARGATRAVRQPNP
jgi:hypothetical protein